MKVYVVITHRVELVDCVPIPREVTEKICSSPEIAAGERLHLLIDIDSGRRNDPPDDGMGPPLSVRIETWTVNGERE